MNTIKISRTIFLMKLFLLAIILTATVQAQSSSVDLSFNVVPDRNSYLTANFILQPDNKIIIFGDFQVVNGIAKNRIARLNTDGSVDNTFNCANCDFTITNAFLQSDGKIIITENTPSQYQSSRIYRLNTDGSRDESFTSHFPSVVYPSGSYAANVRAIQPDGKILVVLDKYTIVPSSIIYRLNSDGTFDNTFTTINVGGGSDSSRKSQNIDAAGWKDSRRRRCVYRFSSTLQRRRHARHNI